MFPTLASGHRKEAAVAIDPTGPGLSNQARALLEMISRSQQESTLAYYDDNAEAYVARTLTADLSDAYRRFLTQVPEGGRILDAGCGSGRDTKQFIDRGYETVAIDASRELVRHASAFTGQPALHVKFEVLEYESEFDAVWACASLHHIDRWEIAFVIRKLAMALRPNGVLYMSMKEGEGDRIADGRFFRHYTEESLSQLVDDCDQLEVLEIWTSHETRSGQDPIAWVSALAKKTDW